MNSKNKVKLKKMKIQIIKIKMKKTQDHKENKVKRICLIKILSRPN